MCLAVGDFAPRPLWAGPFRLFSGKPRCFPEGRTGRAEPCPWPRGGWSWVGHPGWCGPQRLARGHGPAARRRAPRGACPLIRPPRGCEADPRDWKKPRRRGEPGPLPGRSPVPAFARLEPRAPARLAISMKRTAGAEIHPADRFAMAFLGPVSCVCSLFVLYEGHAARGSSRWMP